MGFLGKLFGTQNYVDSGVQLTLKIVESLSLTGWQTYTHEETDAINGKLSGLKRSFNEYAGGEVDFHEAAEGIQRMFIAEALHELAGKGLLHKRTYRREDWKDRVSTYLKAWVCNFDAPVFLDMAELLAEAGYKDEARQALQVVLLFPSYALKKWGSRPDDLLVRSIVEDAQEALENLRLGEFKTLLP